jgi:hypothetical protein
VPTATWAWRTGVGCLVGQREDDMEGAHREEIGLPLRKPSAHRRTLTLRAVPVATAVECYPPVPAVVAGLDVTAKSGGAAGLEPNMTFS